MLGEPVDLELGHELAQLAGDRDVALRVAEPDRRGDVERALAAASRVPLGAVEEDQVANEVPDQRQIGRGRGRARARRCPEPSTVSSLPPVSAARVAPRAGA